MWFAPLLIAATVGAGTEVIHVPNDAVVAALADAATLPEHKRPFARYVWVPDGDKKQAAAVSFAVNTAISKASLPVAVRTYAAGRVARIQLDDLLPRDADLKRGLEIWERQAAGDPYFYFRSEILETVPAYKHTDGQWYTKKRKTVATFGSHVDLKSATLLMGLTKTGVPIQRFDRFIVNTLTTLDKGEYYNWAGIEKSKIAGQTDFEKWLDDHGVSKKRAYELRADRRAAVFKSGVTAKPRAVEEINGLLGVVTWSEDIADGNLDPKAHPILTLLSPKFDATEAIALRVNGLCDFALFDAKGNLTVVVPDTVARDHTIPSPFTSRLQPGISCIRCHGPSGGFQTRRNDVAMLLKNQPEGEFQFDILGDSGRRSFREAIDEIASKYRGNLERLDRARDDYADAVFRATGGLSVAEVSAETARIHDAYQFSDITPQRACEELGVRTDSETAVSVLRQLLPPESAPGGREDARLGFLKAGVSIVRIDWEAVYIDAAIRSRPHYERLAKEQAEKPQKKTKAKK